MQHRIIAERIRFYRKVRGWSQTQLAEQLLTTQCVVSNTENAKKGSWIDSLDKLSLVADALGVDLKTLIFGGGIVNNYKNVLMTSKTSCEVFGFDDLIISLQIGDDEIELQKAFEEAGVDDVYDDFEDMVTAFNLTAMVDGSIVGLINGVYVNACNMFEDPWGVFGELDSLYEIYSDECLALIDKVLPQESVDGDYLSEKLDFSEDEVQKILKEAESIKIADMVEDNEDFYLEEYVVFLDDVIVNPDCRQKGILTKMLDVLEYWFGDYTGCAYIYPVATVDDERGKRVADDENNLDADLRRNRAIAEKFGWRVTDDFNPSATERNSYALKLPEYVLEIAKVGEKFTKYVPHEAEPPEKLRGKTHGLFVDPIKSR